MQVDNKPGVGILPGRRLCHGGCDGVSCCDDHMLAGWLAGLHQSPPASSSCRLQASLLSSDPGPDITRTLNGTKYIFTILCHTSLFI